MKFKPRAEQFDSLSGVNIIPVIDVSLVLLIILLATSPILNTPGFQVKLPKALTSESKEKNISISLSLKGDLAIDQDAVPAIDGLAPRIRRALAGDKKDCLVIIRADEGVTYGQVQELMEIAKKAGAQRIAIATQQVAPDSQP